MDSIRFGSLKLDRHRRALATKPRLIEQAIEPIALASQRSAPTRALTGLQHDGASLHGPATGIQLEGDDFN